MARMALWYLPRRLLLAGLAAALLLGGSLSPSVRAAPAVPTASGEADTTFGGYGDGGRLLTPVQEAALDFRDAVQLPDGSVIAVGSTGADFLIAKYLPSGEPDPGFGAQGVQTVDLSAEADTANAVALAADGKILVAGVANTDTAADFGVVRLNPDGTPDLSFAGDGSQLVDFNGNRDSAADITVLGASGDILVAGTARTGGMYCPPVCFDNFGLARLKSADGALDAAFGTGGKVQTGLAGNVRGLAVVAGNCGLYVGGSRAADLNGPTRFVIASYHPVSGTADTSFGGSGVVSGTTFSRIVDLACSNYGVLALGDGPGDGDDQGDVGLLHLGSNGQPVGGFGLNGLVKHDFGGVDVAGALQILPDNTSLVAGHSGLSLAVARFDGSGSVVTGTVTLTDMAEVGGTAVQALDVALVPDVRYRVVASLATDAGPRLALAQHFLDGSLDAGGRQALDYLRQQDEGRGVAFQPDGKLLVAGATQPLVGNVAKVGLVARYTPAGELDAPFGQGGVVSLAALPGGVPRLLVEPDGKIVALGTAFNLVRLNEAGQADNTFGSQGYASANWPNAASNAIARQADGKLIVAGGRRVGMASSTFAVARFTAEGELDGTFGAGGLVVTSVAAGAISVDAAIQPDGKILVAGYASSDVNNTSALDFALVRYLPDGNLDETFGTNGRVTTDFFGFGDIGYAVLVLPDGKIVAAGFMAGQGAALARYLPTGALDPSFGAGGKLLLPDTSGQGIVDLVLDGPRLVAAICSENVKAGLVARLTLDGAFDSGFNGNGRAPFDFPGDGCPMAIAAAPGRIAAAGTTHAGGGSSAAYLTRDVAVAMYRNAQMDLNERLHLFLPIVMGSP